MRMARLAQKTALVTGAARGIGAAIARAFAEEGARVVLTDIDDDLGRATARAIGAACAYRRLDVREDGDWRSAVDSVLAAHGRLDIVVNNAGITGFDPAAPRPHDVEHATLDDWHAVLRTNLDGVFLGCKHAVRAARASSRPGSLSIINMGSRSGVVGIPRAAAYAASKAAVRNHTKSVALYCAEEGLPVRCNVIQPAAVLTPMWDPLLGEGPDRERRLAEFCRDTPLRRFAAPEEVAALAVYLASDESAYCTGAEFTLDGGLLAGAAATPRD
jgi:NAD(P)-dependent dehydrogenase (short-subunit alcohol dehydrogenase family)